MDSRWPNQWESLPPPMEIPRPWKSMGIRPGGKRKGDPCVFRPLAARRAPKSSRNLQKDDEKMTDRRPAGRRSVIFSSSFWRFLEDFGARRAARGRKTQGSPLRFPPGRIPMDFHGRGISMGGGKDSH